MKKKTKLSNGIHVWTEEWPHNITFDIKDAEILKDADLKYQGLYYQELL